MNLDPRAIRFRQYLSMGAGVVSAVGTFVGVTGGKEFWANVKKEGPKKLPFKPRPQMALACLPIFVWSMYTYKFLEFERKKKEQEQGSSA